MLRTHLAWPVLSVLLQICHAAGSYFNYASIGDAVAIPALNLRQNLSFESSSYGASQVDTMFQFNVDITGPTSPSAATAHFAGEACPTDNVAGTGLDTRLLKTQVEACLNAMRQKPSTFKESFPCDYESMIAPLLASDGDRLPLQTDSPAALQFLSMAAQEEAAELAGLGSVSNASGRAEASLSDRLARVGLYGLNAARVTAAGFPDIRSLVAAWMCSPEHSNVLLSCSYDTAAAGVAFSEDGTSLFSVLDFACVGNCSMCSGPSNQLPQTPSVPRDSIPSAPAGKIASSRFGGAQSLDSTWDDSQYSGITKVRVWVCNIIAANTVCGLEVTYTPTKVIMHGSNVNRPNAPDGTLQLASGESIVQVFGRSGVLIDSIGFKTTAGRTLGPLGGPGGGSQWQVNGIAVGFFGGDYWGTTAAIGVYTTIAGRAKYPTYFGLKPGDYGSTGWDDGVTNAEILAIKVWTSTDTSAIQGILTVVGLQTTYLGAMSSTAG
eukprot:jgi/Botrbrau1/10108/Bobra.20_2s0015.1